MFCFVFVIFHSSFVFAQPNECACYFALYWPLFVGILTQEVTDDDLKKFGNTYIPTSYVTYIESGGARAVPIKYVESVCMFHVYYVLQSKLV